MTKILALTLGLLIAAAAFFALGSGAPLSTASSALPHGSIDDDSRAKLDDVLRGADR